ncbi:COG0553: Superfamily II DNA/RNA helicases, SNF2 family [hydrothermal vent metagenome]|uniref:COG0553: Superfamily II DNA/RNA helicases, SNF2 family n=1 Tax=hydrothermal vent metagenome TaxID=652676 RepID=A0A1W1BPW1_9ZZZZ
MSRQGKTNIVTPASLRTNIKDSIDKFKLPKKDTSVYSFEGATKANLSGDTLIVDEAHRLGDSTSGRSKSLVEAAKRHKRVILLTGSPIRNNPSEIAPLANMVGIDKAYAPLSRKNFDNKYIGKKKEKRSFMDFVKGVKPGTITYIKNKDALKKNFSNSIDKYMPSKDYYPDVIEKTHSIPMSDSQHKLYKNLVDNTNSDVVYKIGNNRPMTPTERANANTFLSAARILSNSEKPFGGVNITPKVKAIADSVTDKPSKNVVYSSFLDGGLNSLSEELKHRNHPHQIYNGSLNDKEKKAIIDKYNKSKTSTLLISGAGAEGLDLKGTRNMHIMEPHWNSARINQVIGRGARFKSHTHLPKEEQNVTVRHYLSAIPNKSVGVLGKLLHKKPKVGADEYMTGLSKRKEELNQEFLNAITG